uniref:Uncharacterized protein LOC111101794 n=1 Tax=Crassostrea virginica TaxID=6565 RepID=A0A8B8AF40_CRAVI|nr:uncharacterized protein LOC111101794 [Crassostrea virginica]
MFLSVFSFCIEVVCLTFLLPPLTLKSAKNIVTLWVYTGKERVLNADLQNIPQQAEARQTGVHLYRVVKSTGFRHAISSPWGQDFANCVLPIQSLDFRIISQYPTSQWKTIMWLSGLPNK